MAYDPNIDYQKLINEAVQRGDYLAAAKAEQSRNEKITSGGLDYATTNKYAGWLDPTDYGTVGKAQMAAGASAQDVLETYKNRYEKAAGTEGLNQYADDEIQAEMWDYITANLNKPQQSFTHDVAQPTYESSYSQRIDDMLNQILNREKFDYSAEADPLYQQYRTMYTREGDRSRDDTLAAVASGAGGMNSYAVTAAQQASDYHMSQLADKIPELYQLAYDMYLNDIDLQMQDLGLLQEMDNIQYGRYRDTMSDWRNDRDFAYGVYRDDVADNQWETSFNYGMEQDALDRNAEKTSGGGNSDVWSAISGMSDRNEVERYLLNKGMSDGKIESWLKQWDDTQSQGYDETAEEYIQELINDGAFNLGKNELEKMQELGLSKDAYNRLLKLIEEAEKKSEDMRYGRD